ncbi:HIRAN domain-containing protein [Arthrobacter sp. YAF34]|uniref:HIRAN domain-containing protein n=1 Tax=Arthrobacter sp. YAF34 TaxID=3233083 RepID=UPI003F8E8E63
MGIIQKLSAFLRGAEVEAKAPEKQHVPERLVAEPEPVKVSATASSAAPESPVRPTTPGWETEPKVVGVKKVALHEAGLSILDLRELPSNRFRIVGSGFWVTDSGRYKHGGSDYVLVREPKNKWDANAVAVYGKGRKVGYLSEAKAAALAPIFDQLPFDAYRVGGAPPADNSIRMWVDVPAVPKLRAFVKTVVQEGD